MNYSISYLDEEGQKYREDVSILDVLSILVAAEESNVGQLIISQQMED